MRTALQLLGVFLAVGVVAHGSAAGDSARKVLEEIKVGGPGGWDYTTFDPRTHNLYIAHGSSIAAVNVLTKVATPHLADAQGAHVAVPFADGTLLLVTHGKSNQVTVNDALTGAVKATIPADAGPDAAILDPVTGHGFVMANGAATVDVIDLKTNEITARIRVGGSPEAAAVDGRGLVLTHLEDKNAIVVIDARTQKVKAAYLMPDCEEPSGIAFITKKNLILSACHNGIVRITNASTGAAVARLPLGKDPDFAIYDDARQLGYVPCGDGTLTVISFSGAQPQVTEVVTTQAEARTGAVDPATGLVYLPTAALRPAGKPGERPGIVPDTFKVLVVGQ